MNRGTVSVQYHATLAYCVGPCCRTKTHCECVLMPTRLENACKQQGEHLRPFLCHVSTFLAYWVNTALVLYKMLHTVQRLELHSFLCCRRISNTTAKTQISHDAKLATHVFRFDLWMSTCSSAACFSSQRAGSEAAAQARVEMPGNFYADSQ